MVARHQIEDGQQMVTLYNGMGKEVNIFCDTAEQAEKIKEVLDCSAIHFLIQ